MKIKNKKNAVIISIVICIAVIIMSFLAYFIVEYNRGETSLLPDSNELYSPKFPLPQWTKVTDYGGLSFVNIKSYLSKEELEKFYQDKVVDKTVKVRVRDVPEKVEYYNEKIGIVFNELVVNDQGSYRTIHFSFSTVTNPIFSKNSYYMPYEE